MTDYSPYTKYLSNINFEDINTVNFKSNSSYNTTLEHVSSENGDKYLNLIETEFDNISLCNIEEFAKINDKFGHPRLYKFILKNKVDTIECSPSSLRYIYQALLILHYGTSTSSIVEIGAGYGGLFLAICYFSNLLNIKINSYHFIDLKEVGILISNYLKHHSDIVNIKYTIHNCELYGKDINDDNLFLISNYCFTEIDEEHRLKYTECLLNKVNHGFIVWQTINGVKLDSMNKYFKHITYRNVEEERPQTAYEEFKNYFVYF
jgi:hypothetical protein